MTTIIIIGIIIFAISRIAKKQKLNAYNRDSFPKQHYIFSKQRQEKEEAIHKLLRNMNKKNQEYEFKDDSIIDISNESYQLTLNQNQRSDNSYQLINYPSGVPLWKHQYIYSTQPLSIANWEQQDFYKTFKRNFLNGIYFDVEGNNNYPFTLLFDLFGDYGGHKNLSKLNNHVNEISIYYPKTAPYARQMLLEQVRNYGDGQYNSQVQYITNIDNNYESDYWKLGGKYKSILKLNEEEVTLLNKIYPPSNNFFSIEFCAIEIIELFLELFLKLDELYIKEETTRERVFDEFLDTAVKKEFRYRSGSENYRNSIEHYSDKLFENIFKTCENAIREHYDHKRKLNIDFNFQKEIVNKTLETEILSKINSILKSIITTVQEPNKKTEIQLNTQNRTRWRSKFKQIKAQFKSDPKGFETAILELEQLNKKNPSIENIFFEAAKFVADADSAIALSFYIYYVHYDLKSSTINNKKLPKVTLKKIFKTKIQEANFQDIINDLIRDKSIEDALTKVKEIFAEKRKKIQLNKTLIQEAHEKHSGTVELLNEYLTEEEEVINIIEVDAIEYPPISEIPNSELINELETSNSTDYIDGVDLNMTQKELLILFFENDFSMSFDKLDEFAMSKGIFKNQLIESVNNACYGLLDDVLIEEEEDVYTIYDDYYQTISTK
jgi:hypothetical protein